MTTMRTGSACSLNVERSALEVEPSSRSPLRLLVISPEAEVPCELTALAQLFAAGLTSYHLRKPTWTRDQLAEYLGALTPDHRSRIVLHTHHELATEFSVRGVHHRDTVSPAREANPVCHVLSDKTADSETAVEELEREVCHVIRDKPAETVGRLNVCIRSRAVHDLATLRASFNTYDRLLLSPVFSSISKPGHGPSSAFSDDSLRAALALPRHAEVIALGGVDSSRVSICRDLGFDGVAVLGAVWNAPDPVAAFRKLLSACSVLSVNSVVH